MLKFTPPPVSFALDDVEVDDANGRDPDHQDYVTTLRDWVEGDFVVGQVINQGGVSGKVANWTFDNTLNNRSNTLTIVQTSGGIWDDAPTGNVSATISQVVDANTTNTWNVLEGSIIDPHEIKTFYSLGHGTDGTVSAADFVTAYSLFEDEELVDISFLIV